MWKGRFLLVILALAHLKCHQVILTAPPGSSLTLFANPEFISANGGVSVISAFVIEPAGTPVADGTVVQFFTNLGRIDEQGKTNDGVARVNLIADSRSGTAKVTGVSGGAAPSTTGAGGTTSSTVTVTIGNLNAKSIFVVADPPGISLTGSSFIIANVFDGNGNPVVGAPVFFSIAATTSGSARDSLDSAGAPRFTDNDGRAFDVLRVRRVIAGTATVRASVPNGATLLFTDVIVAIQ